MIACNCQYSQLVKDEQFCTQVIKGYEPKDNNPWAHVPREPATFGHLVVVSGKYYRDISDEALLTDIDHMKQIMDVINELHR